MERIHGNETIPPNFPQEEYEKEAEVRFDPKIVKESNKRYRSWSKEKIEQLKAHAESILRRLALLKEKPVDTSEVMALIRDYHMYIENYYHVTQEIFMGLAELYIIDPSFTEYFEKFDVGLADYVSRAIQYYCNTEFKELN